MKTTIVVVLFAITLLKDAVDGTDYCRAGLCDPDEKHIGCGATGDFGPSCPAERSLVPMTADVKAYLLKKHNEARMNVANGKIPGYSTCNRMTEMIWDDELAKLAEFNAKTCIYGHDQCRNTDSYQHAGQNIANTRSSSKYKETYKAIDGFFDGWFEEYKDCDMSYITKYRKHDAGAKIGHFTQIVAASANRLGCAITTFALEKKYVYIVCNYGQTNMRNEPIYTTGKPCSGCAKGCSKNYPGLCDSAEVIPL